MATRNDHNPYVLGFFVLLALTAYYTIVGSFFLSDDFAQIGKLLEGNLSFTWGREAGGFFRPIFTLSEIIDSKLWGTNPFGYHLTNVALHALNSYLVFILSLRLMRRSDYGQPFSSGIAATAGLIFLLHPSHTEAVSWISGRADVIATLFFLIALIFYDSYRQERGVRYLAISLVSFLLALFAKESALCLPLIIIVFELTSPKKENRTNLKRTMGIICLFAVVLLIFFLVRHAVLGTFIAVYGPSQHLNFKLSLVWERLPKYLVRTVLPPLPDQLSLVLLKPFKSRAFIIFASIFTVFVSALIILRRRSQSPGERKQQNQFLLLLVLALLCSLLPVITLGISVFDTLGERFIYLPTIFSSIFMSVVLGSLASRPKLWRLAVFCLLVFFAVSLQRSNQRWVQAANLSKSILNDVVSVSKHNDLLILNVPGDLRGVPIYRNGLEDALRDFQQSKSYGRIDVVAFQSLRSTNDTSQVLQQSKFFLLGLSNEKEEFTRVNQKIECIGVDQLSRNSLRIRLEDCFKGRDVFYLSNGKMVLSL